MSKEQVISHSTATNPVHVPRMDYAFQYAELTGVSSDRKQLNTYTFDIKTQSLVIRSFASEEMLGRFGVIRSNNQKREALMLTAIGNLWKKSSFLELQLQEANGSITTEEMEETLRKFPERFVINTRTVDNPNQLQLMLDICIDAECHEVQSDDFCAIFGMRSNSLAYLPVNDNLTNAGILSSV